MAEESAESDAQDPLVPFYAVNGDMQNGASVQAGYMTTSGEVDYLVMDMTDVGISRIEQAFTLAFGWYVDQVKAARNRRAQEAAGEVDGGEPAEADA